MKPVKEKALGFALLIQMLLYCAQSLLLTLLVPLGKRAMLGFSCVSAVAVFFLPVLIYCKLGEVSFKSVLSPENSERRTRRPSKTVLLFVFAVAMTVTAVNVFGQLTEAVTSLFGKSTEAVAESDPIMLALIFVRNVVIASVLEEILFRGAVFNALAEKSPKVKIAVSALLFALMHYSLGQLFYAFAAGAVISFFAYITGSIRFAIGVHFAQNLTSFIFSVLAAFMKEWTFSLLSSIAFFAFAAVAVAGAIYTVFYLRARSKNVSDTETVPHIAPVTAEKRSAPTVELLLYTVLAIVLTVLNF